MEPSQAARAMCHAMPFSARALKKNIFFEVDIVVKKQIEMRFIVVCTLTDNAYKQLICIMQHVHFQVRVGVSVVKANIYSLFLILWLKKNKLNVVLRGLYSCRQRYASSQWSKCCATNWATSQSVHFALVIEYVSSIHPWANSWISQSEHVLCFSDVINCVSYDHYNDSYCIMHFYRNLSSNVLTSLPERVFANMSYFEETVS